MIHHKARNRPQVAKEGDKHRERSKSAHAFKNSQFYEKYLFFEHAKVHHNSDHITSSNKLYVTNKRGSLTSLESVLCNRPKYNNVLCKQAETTSQTTNITPDSNKKGPFYSNSVWRRSAPDVNVFRDVKEHVTPTRRFNTQVAGITSQCSSSANSEQKQDNTDGTAVNPVTISPTPSDKPDLNLSSQATLVAPFSLPVVVSQSCSSNDDADHEYANSDLRANVPTHDRDWLCNSYLERPSDSFSKNTNSSSEDTRHSCPLEPTHALQTDCILQMSSKLQPTSDIIHRRQSESPTHFTEQARPIENSGSTSVRQISTAKMTLKHSYLDNQMEYRKIYVIETCKKPVHTIQKASPRLNEWLKSVMKLHNEQKDIIHWSYPEDERVTVGVNSFLDLDDSQNNGLVTVSSSTVDLISSKESNQDSSQPQTQCVSIGINTDISLSTEDLHIDSCVDSDQDIQWSHFFDITGNIQRCKNQINRYGTQCSTTETKSKINNRMQDPHDTGKQFQAATAYANGNMKTKRTVGNKVVHSDIHGPQISIHVTGDDDHVVNDVNASQSPTLYSSNADVTRDKITETGGRGSNGPVQHINIPKSLSPHCIFPCGHSAWDEDEMSRYLASPRTSICSNSSLLSYKSSNADSAVDLGPTDDDHDFEYVDFCVGNQARRFSHPDDSLAFRERPTLCDTSATISVNRIASAEHTPFCVGAAVRDCPPFLSLCDRSIQENTGNSSRITMSSNAVDLVLSKESAVKTSLHARSIQESARNSSQTIPFSNSTNYSDKTSSFTPRVFASDQSSKSEQSSERSVRQNSCMQIAGFDYSSLDPDKMNSNSRNGVLRYFPGDCPMVGVHNINGQHRAFEETSARAKAAGHAPLHKALGDPAFSEFEHRETRKQSQYHIIPELIISDHSDTNYSQVESGSLQQEHDDFDHQLPSRPTSSLSSSDHSLFEAEESGFARSLSMSSLCSIATTCSTCSEKSDSGLETAASKDEMATTKDTANLPSPTERDAPSEGIPAPPSSPSRRLPSQSPQFRARQVERNDSDEIFLDLYDSQLSLSNKPASSQSTPRHSGISSTYHGVHRQGSSASSSISSTTSPLASISEEEMLIIMESMGEKELKSALPPCSCDECLLREPDTSQHSTRIKRRSSWKKVRSFILWSPFVQVFRKHKYPWIQLAGHQGNFHAGEAGSVLKRLDKREHACYQKLMTDPLNAFVPQYRGTVQQDGDTYIQLEDLLCSFNQPCVMDVKMGIRTYLENELHKARQSPTLRKDMYQKMIEIDGSAPTSEEHERKAVTKPRYMQWRDEMSSSVQFGYRVEGIKKSDGNSSKDFKKTRTRESIVDVMASFVGVNEHIVDKYIKRLKEMMTTQETSDFFLTHEVIGSSILFVHDADEHAGVWMIDFGKSEPLPQGVQIDHRSPWHEGNHEDGYLFGLDNLISVLEEVHISILSSPV